MDKIDSPKINSKKKRKVKIVLAFFLIAVVGLQFYKLYWPKSTIELKDTKLQVLIADNPYRQYKGLGGRKTLAPYDGMLFLFGIPGKYGFVMRDTLFSIDIVWFMDGQVVDIAPSVPVELNVPEANLRRYYPRIPATMVLELPAGWAVSHGLRIGDSLKGGA